MDNERIVIDLHTQFYDLYNLFLDDDIPMDSKYKQILYDKFFALGITSLINELTVSLAETI